MIQYFRSQGTEDVFNGRITSAAQRICPRTLWQAAARKLDLLDSITQLEELSDVLPDVRGPGFHRLPIQDRYEVLFIWGAAGPEQVAIVEKQ